MLIDPTHWCDDFQVSLSLRVVGKENPLTKESPPVVEYLIRLATLDVRSLLFHRFLTDGWIDNVSVPLKVQELTAIKCAVRYLKKINYQTESVIASLESQAEEQMEDILVGAMFDNANQTITNSDQATVFTPPTPYALRAENLYRDPVWYSRGRGFHDC